MSERLRDSFNRLAKQQPKPVSLLEQSPVRFERLAAGRALPLLASAGVADLDLPAWAAESRDRIDEQLLQAGGILFRGFGIASIEEFERLCAALSPSLMDYSERSTPRSEVSGKVYTSTEYPADQEIPLHNELSYAHQWPRKIWFLCLHAAAEGGETPIADSRVVHGLIPEAVRERFVERQVMYVRNFGTGLGLSWSEVFQTEDRAVVEEHCAEAGIELEWGPGDRLRTRAVRPAVTRHPRTGDLVWFNQAHLHHVSSLAPEQRQALLEVVSPEELPFNTYYGDGTEIGEEDLAEVRRAYRQATVTFAWQPGDVLMLDNVLTAHGRAPFTGDRKIVVAMAEI